MLDVIFCSTYLHIIRTPLGEMKNLIGYYLGIFVYFGSEGKYIDFVMTSQLEISSVLGQAVFVLVFSKY